MEICLLPKEKLPLEWMIDSAIPGRTGSQLSLFQWGVILDDPPYFWHTQFSEKGSELRNFDFEIKDSNRIV